MIKLAAFDIDGTLKDKDFIPESTIVALQKLRESGIALAICTGRSEFEIAALREKLGIEWAITCNGSHIGHLGKTVYSNTFTEETVQHWLNEAERLEHTLLLCGSELMFINRSDAPLFRQAQREIGYEEPLLIQSIQDVPGIYQCIVFCGEEDEKYYLGAERESYYIHRWRPWAVDFNPNGMHKAMGLKKLLNHLNISADQAAAFGDGLNDLEMIESVGMGIAMGNAIGELKEKARFVTKSLHENGIEYAVNKWLLADTN